MPPPSRSFLWGEKENRTNQPPQSPATWEKKKGLSSEKVPLINPPHKLMSWKRGKNPVRKIEEGRDSFEKGDLWVTRISEVMGRDRSRGTEG